MQFHNIFIRLDADASDTTMQRITGHRQCCVNRDFFESQIWYLRSK